MMQTQTATHYHVTDGRGTPIFPRVFFKEEEARKQAIKEVRQRPHGVQWRECTRKH